MKLRYVALALAAAPLALLAPAPSSQQGTVVIPNIQPLLQREPTLVFDITGFSLLGELHTSMVVYNDGLVSYSNRSGFLGGDGQSCTVSVPQNAVRKLTRNLAGAGAGALEDNQQLVLDVPLTTVTFMKPGTDTKAHTFSFYIGGSAHSEVSQIIGEFVAENIPVCTGNEL
jgi:hypothetical protein